MRKSCSRRSRVACVASVSSRVRRESWDESKKKRKDATFFFCSRSNFRAVTRLEKLATQATVESNFSFLSALQTFQVHS